MDSKVVGAHVLSVRSGETVNQPTHPAWIFGVVLDHDLEGHARWIVETRDEAVIAQLRSAYEGKTHTHISRNLLIDPIINAVE